MIFFKRRKLNRILKKMGLLSDARKSDTVPDSAIKREIGYLKKAAAIYDTLVLNKAYPFAKEQAIECYRLAANLGDPESAQVIGERFLNQGKYWLDLEQTIYYDPDIHPVYANRCFEEAYAFLNTADKRGDVIGKRQLGVLYVNGWGVEENVDKGIELVMESLNIANAWSESAAILADLGLTNPEFFKKLTLMSGGHKP